MLHRRVEPARSVVGCEWKDGWVGWEVVVVIVPAVSVTWLPDEICPVAIATDHSINQVEPETQYWSHLRELVGK